MEASPTPSSGAVTSSMNGPITETNFKEVVLRTCASLLDTHGGPAQYLKSVLGASPNSKWNQFHKDLKLHFPKRHDLVYLEGRSLPRDVDPSTTFKLNLWHLGWVDGCSTKPPTFKITANQLVDEYLTSSVQSASEPLLLYQGPEDQVHKCSLTQEPFVLFMLCEGSRPCYHTSDAGARDHVCSQSGLGHLQPRIVPVYAGSDLPAWHCCHRSDLHCFGKRTALSKGLIRKMHDVITWGSKLMTLKRKGLSRTEIIRRWNESSTAAASLSGGRKNIEFPNDCMEILIQHISEFGPDQSAFTDGKAPSKPYPRQGRERSAASWRNGLPALRAVGERHGPSSGRQAAMDAHMRNSSKCSRATARKGKVPIPWQVPGKRGSLGQGRTQLALLAEKGTGADCPGATSKRSALG